MVPNSPVAICNLALDRIGAKSVASIDAPTTPEEIVCGRWYDETRRRLLRDYVWNFARKLATLTYTSAVTPAFGYDRAYYLPTDCIRLLSLGNHVIGADLTTEYYTISENLLYTNSASDTTLNIEYIFDNQDTSQYDASFIELLSLRLAKAIAYKFTLKPSLLNDLRVDLQDLELRAAAVAGQEKPPRVRQVSRILTRRRYQNFNSQKYYD